jgi:hypothetical protein
MKVVAMHRFGLVIIVWTALAGAGAADDHPATPGVVARQAEDGSILLHGSTAEVHGTRLRWEPQEKKRTLGFWTKAEDYAEWKVAVEASGAYDIEVLQGCGTGQGGSEMAVTLDPGVDAAQTIRFVVEDTGGFQAFRPRTIGRVTLTAGDHVLRIKPEQIAKQAACDIRQIRLVPAK